MNHITLDKTSILNTYDEYKNVYNNSLDSLNGNAKILLENSLYLSIFTTFELFLKDIIDNGIRINADVSVQLIRNIFEKDTPLHDGAVIISGGRVMSACSILPLAVDSDINKSFGTRHRAAIGISKNSDAIAVVVSEETGKISVARNNMLTVDIKEEGLKKLLLKYLLDIDLEKETKDNDNIILRKMKKVKEKFRKKEMEQSAKVEKG